MLGLLNIELLTHPFSVLRAAELKKWVDSGAYAAKTYKQNFTNSDGSKGSGEKTDSDG